MNRYDNDVLIHDLQFNKAIFWVQVHDIPIRYRNKAVAEKICDALGEVVHTPDTLVHDGGSFIRIRVTIDVFLPLCKGRLISTDNGKQVWVSFKYERLPNICYWCGFLDHDDKDCDV